MCVWMWKGVDVDDVNGLVFNYQVGVLQRFSVREYRSDGAEVQAVRK